MMLNECAHNASLATCLRFAAREKIKDVVAYPPRVLVPPHRQFPKSPQEALHFFPRALKIWLANFANSVCVQAFEMKSCCRRAAAVARSSAFL